MAKVEINMSSPLRGNQKARGIAVRKTLLICSRAIILLAVFSSSPAQEVERYFSEQKAQSSAEDKRVKSQGEGYRCKMTLSGFDMYETIYFFDGKKYNFHVDGHIVSSHSVNESGSYFKWEAVGYLVGDKIRTVYELNRKTKKLTSVVITKFGPTAGDQRQCSRIK